MWNEITYLRFNRWGLGMDIIPHFTGHAITYPCWDSSQSVLVKWAQWVIESTGRVFHRSKGKFACTLCCMFVIHKSTGFPAFLPYSNIHFFLFCPVIIRKTYLNGNSNNFACTIRVCMCITWLLNERKDIFIYQPLDCLLGSILGWHQRKPQSSASLTLFEGNPLVTGGLPSQRPVMLCHDVIMNMQYLIVYCPSSFTMYVWIWNHVMFTVMFMYFVFICKIYSCIFYANYLIEIDGRWINKIHFHFA